jgi:glutamate synthase domain-containing protein 2
VTGVQTCALPIWGAKLGGFFQNTGEGGISPYHLENGGDLCFQIGTGYFGAGKTVNGVRYFDEVSFVKNSTREEVKMIEIKLSQGAKPGHGGILPAKKNTQEIADIRGVEAGVDVMSPPHHTAFNDSKSMLEFVDNLRQLSGGKPVGIKLCVGDEKEVEDLINMMKEMDMYPDFITIDGGEGGTGAAPLVFTNNIGSPLLDSLIFVNKQLKSVGLRSEIKIIASGKASTSFDIIKLLSLGADSVNAARAFMLSLGCIQARECNKNTCPVGIATQNKTLVAGLNPAEKKVRVYNYHKALIHELREVIGAMGLVSVDQLTEDKVFIRVNDNETKSYKDLYKI